MPESIPSRSEEISLREHLEAQIEGVRRELMLVQVAAKAAVDKAEATMNERLTGMNEWRGQSKDRENTFSSKEDMRKVETRIAALENRNSNLDGRLWAIGAAITVINTLIALAPLLLKGGR